jgi:uncharacterized heparinase superfamily protein
VLLTLPDREAWTFSAFDDAVQIEESVFLAGADGPRRTVQIVIYGNARQRPRVQWSFRHAPRTNQTRRETATEEPELPL